MRATKSEQSKSRSGLSGFIIERTAKRMKQYFKRMLKQAATEITVDQWVILQLLDRQDGLSQFEIANETYKDAPTVTRIIDLLCQKQLTERISDASDRRKFKIYLTDQGHDKVAEVQPIVQTFRQRAWGNLSAEDIQQMNRILDLIFYNLD